MYAWTVRLPIVIIYIYYQDLNWYIPFMLILWIVNLFLIIAINYSLKCHTLKMKMVWRRNHYRSWLLVRLCWNVLDIWINSSENFPKFDEDYYEPEEDNAMLDLDLHQIKTWSEKYLFETIIWKLTPKYFMTFQC